MVNHEDMKKNCILIIDDDISILSTLKDMLIKAVSNIEIITTQNPLDGIRLHKEMNPCIVVIDANMPIMNGYSVCSIIRKVEQGDRSKIYMITADACRERIDQAYYVGFDYCFEKPINESNFIGVIRRFFEKKKKVSSYFCEIEKARKNQEKMLPRRITLPNFSVDYIYSPFQDLSGDFIDYWLERDKDGLCGYIFDVAGHDICSSLQVSEVRALFKYGFNSSHELNEVLAYVNREIFVLHPDPMPVAGVVFRFDFKAGRLFFCSAGISGFFVVSKNEFVEISMSGYLLGFKEDADYTKNSIMVDNVDEIIFSSDGFSELVLKNSVSRFAKHDDVSAIMIRLKKMINNS